MCFVLSGSVYLLNALVLENGSLLVLQIQGRPKEAISLASTVGERKRAELYNRPRLTAGKTYTVITTSNIQDLTICIIETNKLRLYFATKKISLILTLSEQLGQ